MSLLSNAVVRAAEIRRDRSADIRRVVMISIIQTQVLFWAWVVGWHFGPVALLPIEVLVGAVFTLALGIVSSWLGLRCYLERNALLKLRVREDRKKRRLVMFSDHLWLGDELVVRSEISSFEEVAERFEIEYRPSDGGSKRHRVFEIIGKKVQELNPYFSKEN